MKMHLFPDSRELSQRCRCNGEIHTASCCSRYASDRLGPVS